MTHKNTRNSVDSLLQIMRTLREPGGCPWDAEQTPESLTPYIIEEACELVDAIENSETDQIRDELGDLLLQVVFQAQIFSERNQFDFHDVAAGIAEKLVRRHPHVFENEYPQRDDNELDRQWEEIKKQEKTQNKSCLADHLPSQLPALQRTQKLISRLYKSGRQQELAELHNDREKFTGLRTDPSGLTEKIVGQLIFLIVKAAYEAGIDAESALRKTTAELLIKFEDN